MIIVKFISSFLNSLVPLLQNIMQINISFFQIGKYKHLGHICKKRQQAYSHITYNYNFEVSILRAPCVKPFIMVFKVLSKFLF